MARVLGVVAGLLWIVGMVLLVVGLLDLPGDVTVRSATPDGGFFVTSDVPVIELATGTILVGVAGMLTGGLVVRPGRRRAEQVDGLSDVQ